MRTVFRYPRNEGVKGELVEGDQHILVVVCAEPQLMRVVHVSANVGAVA
jgi:hypothetical protein